MKMKHLTLEERKQIQSSIEDGLSKTAIARTIGKNPTTVSKEILRHRTLKPRNRFNQLLFAQNSKTVLATDAAVLNNVLIILSNPACVATAISALAIIATNFIPASWTATFITLQKHMKLISFI